MSTAPTAPMYDADALRGVRVAVGQDQMPLDSGSRTANDAGWVQLVEELEREGLNEEFWSFLAEANLNEAFYNGHHDAKWDARANRADLYTWPLFL